jgi:hypothetical protein
MHNLEETCCQLCKTPIALGERMCEGCREVWLCGCGNILEDPGDKRRPGCQDSYEDWAREATG